MLNAWISLSPRKIIVLLPSIHVLFPARNPDPGICYCDLHFSSYPLFIGATHFLASVHRNILAEYMNIALLTLSIVELFFHVKQGFFIEASCFIYGQDFFQGKMFQISVLHQAVDFLKFWLISVRLFENFPGNFQSTTKVVLLTLWESLLTYCYCVFRGIEIHFLMLNFLLLLSFLIPFSWSLNSDYQKFPNRLFH